MLTLKNQPGVTWLLPVKNGMPWLPRTLASIATQTYGNHRVIAWDNGSNDGTVDVLRRWIDPDAHVNRIGRLRGQVIVNRPMGLGASLAAMVEMADTEFCARIDADDINEPNRLETQIEFMQRNRDVALVGSAFRLIDKHDRILPGASSVAVDDAAIRWRLRFFNAFNHPTVMFRRHAVLRAGNYHDIMPIEDFDLWVRLAMKYEMANIAMPLVRYRMLDTSVSAVNNNRIDAVRCNIINEYAPGLFPGMRPEELSRLFACVTTPDTVDIKLSDLNRLHRAATNAATFAGKPGNFFRDTRLFRMQANDLRVRWLKSQPGVNTVWNLAKHLRGRSPNNNTTQRQAA